MMGNHRRVAARRALCVVCFLSLSALTSCNPPAASIVPTFAPPPTQLPSGSTYTVDYGSVTASVEIRGRVVSRRETPIVFTLEGVLKEVYVSTGDAVDEGAVLAELDAPELQEAVEQAQYDLQEAEEALEVAELQLSLIDVNSASSTGVLAAEIALKKAAAALAHAQEEYDKAVHRTWEPPEVVEAYAWELQLQEWNYQLAEAALLDAQDAQRQAQYSLSVQHQIQELRVEQARRAVDRANARVADSSQQLTSTQVTAPFSGIVIAMNKGVGDRVGPYEAFGTIADPSEFRVVAVALEEDAGRIGVGLPAVIKLDAYPDREFAGSVLQIAGQPVAWEGKTAYEITIAFDTGQDVPLALQMGADVVVTGQARENVLVVPNRALLTIGGRTYVELVGEGGAAERVEVETGISSDAETEIVAGLQAGQTIRIP